jgi:hypothetical protein
VAPVLRPHHHPAGARGGLVVGMWLLCSVVITIQLVQDEGW